MVYLNLSVINLKITSEFYSYKLGMFKCQTGSRLICIYAPLIIDLREIGTDRHVESFGINTGHTISSFWVHIDVEEENTKLDLIRHLKGNNVAYKEVTNLGGHYLSFTDPSENKFTIHADHGVIK